MVAGCTSVHCGEFLTEFLPLAVLETAVLRAFEGEAEGIRFTNILLLTSHDHVLRRVKLFLGHDPDASEGTMGEPITQPCYIQVLIDYLTRILAMQLQIRLDVPYNQRMTTARGLAVYLGDGEGQNASQGSRRYRRWQPWMRCRAGGWIAWMRCRHEWGNG